MVAVAVREQDGVEVGQLVGSDDGGGIIGEKWVDDNALSVPLQHKTGVSVECGFHSPTCFAYASAPSSPSNSLASWSFTFTIQPLPYGSRFTSAGTCSSSSFASTIGPTTEY